MKIIFSGLQSNLLPILLYSRAGGGVGICGLHATLNQETQANLMISLTGSNVKLSKNGKDLNAV